MQSNLKGKIDITSHFLQTEHAWRLFFGEIKVAPPHKIDLMCVSIEQNDL